MVAQCRCICCWTQQQQLLLLLRVVVVCGILLTTGVVSSNEQQQQQDEILLESFEHAADASKMLQHKWKEMNDPVMGGKSTGTFEVLSSGFAVFRGQVVDVPYLHDAPGFIQVRTVDHHMFPDVSSCRAFQLTIRSLTTNYTGYRFSFGRAHPPHGKLFAYGYKTTLPPIRTATVSHQNCFFNMTLPFDEFSDYWDDATGDAIVTCHQDSQYCPTRQALQNLQTMALWGEGVAGPVHLEIRSIRAVGCAS